MMENAILLGKPSAGNPHDWPDDGKGASCFPTAGRLVLLALAAALSSVTAFAMTRAELQAAINAAAEGGRVELTGDVDLDEPLQVDGRRLTLASPEGVRHVITRTEAKCLFAKISKSGTDVRLENVEFDGNKAAYGSSMGPDASIIEIAAGQVTLGAGSLLRDVLVKSGGSIYVHGTGVLVMEDGAEIRNFSNPNYGAAVRVGGSTSYTDGTFRMMGGLITGCECSHSSLDMGGVVYLWGGRVELSGGTITGNKSPGGIAGINLYMGDLRISGDAVIFGNQGGKVDDVYVREGYTAQIWVFDGYCGRMTVYQAAVPAIGTQSLIWTGSGNSGYAKGLGNVSLQGHPDIVLDGYYWSGGCSRWAHKLLTVSSRGTIATLAEMQVVLADNDVVTLSTNVGWTSTYEFSSATNVTFTSDANGPWTIERRQANVPFWQVKDGSIRLENIVLDGNGAKFPITETASNSPLLDISENGRVTLGRGGVIRGAASVGRAPGVLVGAANSVFRMEDGSAIVDCSATGPTSYATAVMVGNGSSYDPRPRFEMAGGVISNCTCNLDTSCASVGSGYGGIVYVYDGDFLMTGGQIVGNHSSTTCSGVQFYSGTVRVSGTARIEGNDGPYPDFYVRSSKQGNCRAFGDFRGHVGLCNTTASAGSSAGVTVESGTTGAWSFFPSGQTDSQHYVGVVDADGETVKWGAVAGSIDGVEIGSKADADRLCPKSLVLDDAGMAALPHVFSGVAKQVEATVALAFDVEEMVERLRATKLPLVVFRTDDGTGFSGKLSFTLPDEAADRLVTVTAGGVCKLCLCGGLLMILR